MMLAKTIFGITLVLVLSCKGTYQQLRLCREHHFQEKGSCYPCPDRCEDCTNNLNCTTCRDNYYGPVCQHNCPGCRECHKEYGYCTYGCPDGYYPLQDSGECPLCPDNCKLCKSINECYECRSGYYGDVCATQCSNCDRCDKITGKCIVCAEGHFNKDGQCHECHESCVRCYDERNCSRCKDGYILIYNGQCIMDCLMEEAEEEQRRACLNHEAHLPGDMIACKSETPCIKYNPCSSNIICSSQHDEKSSCGTIDTYQCSHLCYRNECDSNCTIRQSITSVMSFCLTSKSAFSVIKLITHLECSDVSEAISAPTCQQSTPWGAIIHLILVLIAFLLLLGGVIVFWCRMRRERRYTNRANTSERSEATDLTEKLQSDPEIH